MNKYEREYIKNEVVFFRKTKEQFGELSNMASGFSLQVNDVIIPSAEALYQACKYPLFPKIQEEIISQSSPMTAKMISKKYQNFTRQDWEEIKFDIMYWVLQVKLLYNYERFSRVLIQTLDKPIVELSHKDRIWGAVEQNGILVGRNALGRLLMQLRKEFIFENKSIDRILPPRKINGFLFYGSEIEITQKIAIEMLFNID